ncbi:hypothetical protein PGTUg99_012386 [Puccinia graminis f. sp. tritici]|uniref:Uncharacterized protein n=1 Tax=Puccinia graminis f. sp. tritici TaxID=56615 RepID=A0A5B0P5Z8_PUCGR|nr:hypothetical protein PGTUg99_012386 [Puccinia graminis f. sp. tritici]
MTIPLSPPHGKSTSIRFTEYTDPLSPNSAEYILPLRTIQPTIRTILSPCGSWFGGQSHLFSSSYSRG